MADTPAFGTQRITPFIKLKDLSDWDKNEIEKAFITLKAKIAELEKRVDVLSGLLDKS